MKKLTDTQLAVLRFIQKHVNDNGYPPTQHEIRQHFGWASQNAATGHIDALRRKGWLSVTPKIAPGLGVVMLGRHLDFDRPKEYKMNAYDMSHFTANDGNTPLTYQKRPVKIQALQWTGENIDKVVDFLGDTEWLLDDKGLSIGTLEGLLLASIGDYIIRGIRGEFYPCKPEIFCGTYILVGA